MITSLTLKKVATYPNEGVTINDLKKLNFFFGFNGCGKSTIAKYLSNVGASVQEPLFAQCSQAGFDTSGQSILVFNDKFTDDNFIKRSSLKGVFSLNQKNEEIDRSIQDEEKQIKGSQRLVEQRDSLNQRLSTEREKANTSISSYCWSQRDTFKAFTKIQLEHAGSKVNHFSHVKRILSNTPALEDIKIEVLKTDYDLAYERELKRIDRRINPFLYKQILTIEQSIQPLLDEVIVGNEDVDIAQLMTELNNRSWVEKGTEYLRKDDPTCPFCQKPTIDDTYIKQIELLFDETYKKKVDKLRRQVDNYIDVVNRFLKDIDFLRMVYDPQSLVSDLYIKLEAFFRNETQTLKDKLSQPNEKKILNSIRDYKPQLSKIIKRVNTNNDDFKSLDSKRAELLKSIWKYIAFNCKDRIQSYNDLVSKIARIQTLVSNSIDTLRARIKGNMKSIETLRQQTVNTNQAVDNINLILRNSGFEGFSIKEKEKVNNISQYFLSRPDNVNDMAVFKTLSEGEKNFIAFLYFYQLCLGVDELENSPKKKIIVIDDPVSSLDSQSLFIVSTLIQNLIKRKGKAKPDKMNFSNENIEQVFILTHNLYFYKEVSFSRRPICTDWWHYRISKGENKTSIIGSNNTDVADDYTLMWTSLRSLKKQDNTNKSNNVLIANLMRRIIESYVNFIGYGKNSWAALSENDAEHPNYYLKSAFISAINDESHKVSPMDSVYYQKIIAENPDTLFDVFKIIFQAIGKDHYSLMMDELEDN